MHSLKVKSKVLFFLVFITSVSFGFVSGDYRSNVLSGPWSHASSWEVFDGLKWTLALNPPSSTSTVLIRANNLISIDTICTCKYLSFANNTGTSQIDFNVAFGELSIYGDAEFRDGINSIRSWVPDAKLVFRGFSNQVITTGTGTRFYSIEINKEGGIVTQAGGATVRIEKSLLVIGKGNFVLGSNTNLEGVQFANGVSASLPTIKIDTAAAMQLSGNTIVRSGSSGTNPIGNVTIDGALNLTSTSATGINFSDVVVGNGMHPATLNITGAWGSGTFRFSGLTVNNKGVYHLAATTIGNSNQGVTLYDIGSKVIYGNGASSNLPFADVNYYDLTLGSTATWTMAANRIIDGNMELEGPAVLTITGPQGVTADLKTLSVKGNINCENSAVLKFRHANINLEGDMVLKSGAFEGGTASSSSGNSAQHIFNGNIIIDNGSMRLTTTDSDPVYYVKGNIAVNNGGTFIGTTNASGNPSLNIQRGISTDTGSVFKATDITAPTKTTLFTINFSNESGYNAKSDVSVSTGLTNTESLWRFSILPGRTVYLKSEIELGGDTIKTTFTSFEVKGNAVLNTDTFSVKGAFLANDTRFIMSSGALLQIGHAKGITASPSLSGAIQTNTRKYLSTAHYSYTGKLNQETGNGLPSTIKNLTINNSGVLGNNSVALTNTALSIGADTCTITSGIFDVGAHTFSGTNGNLFMTGGALKISKISGTTLLPELTGTYNLTGGTIELNGNGNQVIRGMNTYYHLKFSGTNVPGVSYKNPSSPINITHTLEITDDAILDAKDVSGNAVSIAGPGGLTMSGNSWFRMKKLNTTLPELTAINPGTDYLLTGGTVELYGSGANQTHSLNGTKGAGSDIHYHKVILNADGLNQAEANVVLQSSIFINNTFIVNAPASFQISNSFSIKGPGNFELKPGATLQYGSPDGISLLPNIGNIRVAGTRTLPSSAGYGLIGGVEMVSGSLLPDTVNNLFINKTNGTRCTLSKAIRVNGDLLFRNGTIHTTTTNSLIIQAGATVTGASSTSYVAGPVMKIGNAAFRFPTGKNGYYRPIAISAPVNLSDAFTAEYFIDNPENKYGDKKDAFIDHISQCEYWILDRTMGISNAFVTLTWDENSCGVDNFADLRVVKWNGQKWKNYGNTNFSTINSSSGNLTSDTVTSFCPFTLASVSASNPLPISLLSFDAKYTDKKVVVTWVTANEYNNDYFTLERSMDGINYTSIAKINGAGTSTQINEYSYTDTDALSGIIYYRLKQTDLNGDSVRTDSIMVEIGMDSGFFIANIYTVDHMLHLSINDPFNSLKSIRIFDFIGRELYSSKSTEQHLQIPLFTFAKDNPYLISISNGGERVVRKFFY